MSEPTPPDARTAVQWCILGSVFAGLALPLVTAVVAPDHIWGTTAPLGAIAKPWIAGAGLWTLMAAPLAVVTALASRRFPVLVHAPRALAVFIALAPIPVTGWFFAVRTARLDLGTALGGALVVFVLAAISVPIGRALKPIDAHLGRLAAVVVGGIVLLTLVSGMPQPAPLAEPAPLPEPTPYTAPKLDDANPERPRTVLFLTVDTLRADHLGAWGYDRATSPVLDALAADGLRVERMIAASSGTVPSFGTLHTGLLPECTGVVHQLGSLGPGAVTLAERFSEAGYATLGVATNHNLDDRHGFTQGFDTFENLGEATGDQVVDRAIELWPDGPTFAWIHLFDPHTPYRPPDALVDDFRGDALYDDTELPVIEFGSWGGVHRERTFEAPIPTATVSRGEVVARYDAEIAYTDEQVGRLLEWMERSGRLDDTVIVFTADHGETLTRGPRDVMFQHALQTFDDDLAIPTFLWGPERIATGSIDVPTRHIDVVPTVLDAARLPRDASLPGRSLLRDGPRNTVAISRNAWWDAVSLRLTPLAAQGATRTVEHDGYKLIRTPHQALTEWDPAARLDAWRGIWSGIHQDDRLFHVAADPGEEHDVIDAHPEIAARLEGLLAAELERGLPDLCRDARGTDIELDAETRERLRQMGYLD